MKDKKSEHPITPPGMENTPGQDVSELDTALSQLTLTDDYFSVTSGADEDETAEQETEFQSVYDQAENVETIQNQNKPLSTAFREFMQSANDTISLADGNISSQANEENNKQDEKYAMAINNGQNDTAISSIASPGMNFKPTVEMSSTTLDSNITVPEAAPSFSNNMDTAFKPIASHSKKVKPTVETIASSFSKNSDALIKNQVSPSFESNATVVNVSPSLGNNTDAATKSKASFQQDSLPTRENASGSRIEACDSTTDENGEVIYKFPLMLPKGLNINNGQVYLLHNQKTIPKKYITAAQKQVSDHYNKELYISFKDMIQKFKTTEKFLLNYKNETTLFPGFIKNELDSLFECYTVRLEWFTTCIFVFLNINDVTTRNDKFMQLFTDLENYMALLNEYIKPESRLLKMDPVSDIYKAFDSIQRDVQSELRESVDIMQKLFWDNDEDTVKNVEELEKVYTEKLHMFKPLSKYPTMWKAFLKESLQDLMNVNSSSTPFQGANDMKNKQTSVTTDMLKNILDANFSSEDDRTTALKMFMKDVRLLSKEIRQKRQESKDCFKNKKIKLKKKMQKLESKQEDLRKNFNKARDRIKVTDQLKVLRIKKEAVQNDLRKLDHDYHEYQEKNLAPVEKNLVQIYDLYEYALKNIDEQSETSESEDSELELPEHGEILASQIANDQLETFAKGTTQASDDNNKFCMPEQLSVSVENSDIPDEDTNQKVKLFGGSDTTHELENSAEIGSENRESTEESESTDETANTSDSHFSANSSEDKDDLEEAPLLQEYKLRFSTSRQQDCGGENSRHDGYAYDPKHRSVSESVDKSENTYENITPNSYIDETTDPLRNLVRGIAEYFIFQDPNLQKERLQNFHKEKQLKNQEYPTKAPFQDIHNAMNLFIDQDELKDYYKKSPKINYLIIKTKLSQNRRGYVDYAIPCVKYGARSNMLQHCSHTDGRPKYYYVRCYKNNKVKGLGIIVYDSHKESHFEIIDKLQSESIPTFIQFQIKACK